jgi:putative heme iron utilization protein
MSQTPGRAGTARRLLRSFTSGVMGTRGVRHAAYPYTAALPFCTDQQGRVIVLISHLSEHTKAVENDPRVSFTAAPMTAQLRPQARLTVLGTIVPEDDPAVAARYLRFFPDNQQFLEIGGFRFFAIEPDHVRLIAGFGSAHWLDGQSMLAEQLPIAHAEQDIIDHMNNDHRNTLLEYCRNEHGATAGTADMVGIDCDGFDVRADDTLYHFDFDPVVTNAGEARAALVALARSASA